MSHPPIRSAIRHQLLSASDNLRRAADDIAEAIEQLDCGDFWDKAAGDAKMNAAIAQDQITMARGMAHVASLAPAGSLR